jgi:hypothetical protein
MNESCTGQGGTLARIRKSGFSIAVPDGWTYAQGDDATIATAHNAVFAITTYEAGADAKAAAANRDGAFDALVKLLGISPPKRKVAWTRPSKKSKVGEIELSLWQADDVTKEDKKGPVLIFAAQLPDKSWLLGAGFVPADDATDSDKAILGSIQSIAPSPPAPPATP